MKKVITILTVFVFVMNIFSFSGISATGTSSKTVVHKTISKKKKLTPTPTKRPVKKSTKKPTKKPTPRSTKKPTPKPTKKPTPTPTKLATPTKPGEWQLKYDETFDTPFIEPPTWTEDKYGETSPYHVSIIDEDGSLFLQSADFLGKLNAFKSFRKSFTYGQDNWLTVEEYGRDSNKDGIPESGGSITNKDGVGLISSPLNTDGAIIRSTNPLPSKYRIEVKISNINFGGQEKGSWTYDEMTNGYTQDAKTGPWDSSPSTFVENGMHFLGITDCKPAPHENKFWYSHRKVFMETDNNGINNDAWSRVWNPVTKTADPDGSHPIMMLWSNGQAFSSYTSPLPAWSYTADGFKNDGTSVDKYLDNESYIFSIERDGDSYTLSVTGKFFYGGYTTYKATRKFTDPTGAVWHYNNTATEYKTLFNQKVTINGKSYNTWPAGSAYPDYFYFGDPHINFYAGNVKFDDLKLYVYQ